jgi:hypothetical protein
MRSLDRKQYAGAAPAGRALTKKVERVLQRSKYLPLDYLADGWAVMFGYRYKKQTRQCKRQRAGAFPSDAASGRCAMKPGRLFSASERPLHARKKPAENILHCM